MNVLYEDIVAEGLRPAFEATHGKWVRHPSGWSLDEADSVRIVPDLVWFGSDRKPLIVIDAKYKATEEARRADLYQIVSYCRAMGVAQGVLVYADVDETRLVVRDGGPTVHVLRLAIDGDLREVRAALDALADRLRALAS
jgi:5-methylcytosine-specific restriction enzyme subunit McrC